MAGSAPDDDLDVGSWSIPGTELEWRFSPSGGPGGQHANRSNTRADLTFHLDATDAFPAEVKERLVDRLGAAISVSAGDSRSQFRNRMRARARLREMLEEAARPPRRRRTTSPTRASRQRRLEDKRARGEKKRLRRRPDLD